MEPANENLYQQAVIEEETPTETPTETPPETPTETPTETPPKEPEDDFVLPEKFKGKELRDIAKSYVELEKSIEKKASQRAREIADITPKEEEEGNVPEWIDDAISGVDFSKMKPDEFAAFMLNTIESRAQEIARNTYTAADNTKADVQQAIETVTKDWPQLKENEGFRDMVLSLIENSAGKGEILALEDACTKVGKAMGLEAGKTPEKPKTPEKKDTRTGVEKSTGASGTVNQTEEEKILQGLSQQNPSGLGGLY